jgi:Rrf2 family protein
MNLSNTAQYAIRVISYMAHKKQVLYSASDLIKELKISDKYLKRILTTLSNNDIIKSVQGRYGGFSLHKDLEKISLFEIVKAVDNIEKYFGCILGFEECSDENPCSLHTKWMPLKTELLAFLENTNMSDVIKNPQIVKH